MNLTASAPAKINWTLEVLGRRDDGYHEVRTVMQTIDICDEVLLEKSDALTLSVEGAHAATDEDHTLVAARLLGKELGRELPASIHIRKRIPVSAGLGGGSSDAAAVLRGLDALYHLDAGIERLGSVATRVGSDAAFFLYGGTALGEGRGERITPLPDAPEAWLVVLAPPIPLAEKTRRMYAALRPGDFTDGSMTQRLADRIRAGQPVRASDLYNAFERAAREPQLRGALVTYREAMLAAGADAVHLAGAGPGMFSLHGSRAEAEGVAARLGETGGRVFVARTRGREEGGRWKEEGGKEGSRGRIILVGTELMSESRIAEGGRALGYEVQAAGTIEAVIAALASTPADVLILDLQAEGVPWREVVKLARRAGGSGLAVLGYGRHIKPELVAAALDAGCDLVAARSEVMGDLQGAIERAFGAAARRV